MKRSYLLVLLGITAGLTTGLLVMAGCGGSGGPLLPSPSSNAPSVSSAFLQILPAAQRSATYVGNTNCITCHDQAAAGAKSHVDLAKFNLTRHANARVGCEQCHGPGSLHVQWATDYNASPTGKDPLGYKQGILTFPEISRIQVCAQCHGPTTDAFDTSKHARLVEDVIAEAGTTPQFFGKTCLRCHSAPFRVTYIDAPMARGATADEVDARINSLDDATIRSFVGTTHETATCAACHDPHKQTGKVDALGEEHQLLRKATETNPAVYMAAIGPGAPAKLHTTFDHICGNCHNGRGVDPSDAKLQTGTARPSMHEGPQYNMLMGLGGAEGSGIAIQRNTSHAAAEGQCSKCHLPNGRHTFTVSYDISCQPCHTTEDANSRASIKGVIELRLFTLRTRMQNWSKKAFGDPDLWDYTTLVPPGKKAPAQNLIPIEVKRARHNYYFVLRDKSFGIHNSFYTRSLLDVADAGLDAVIGRAAATDAAGRSISQAAVKAVLNADLLRGYRADRRPIPSDFQ